MPPPPSWAASPLPTPSMACDDSHFYCKLTEVWTSFGIHPLTYQAVRPSHTNPPCLYPFYLFITPTGVSTGGTACRSRTCTSPACGPALHSR
jgi:hypothetical protein